jgi:N utilization substance protein A
LLLLLIYFCYYILHDLFHYVKIALYELITERTEKWATPTFLLVIHSAARLAVGVNGAVSMSKNEFALAFNEVLEEKQLSKDVILGAIESAMVSAYRRAVNASTAQHVEAKIDPETGKVMVFAEKEVVEDVQEPKTEVLLDEARKVNPEAQLGDMVVVETTPADFGRVAAQTARQVIQQRIREAERSNQMQYFERQVGEIVSGIVQATNAQATTIGLDMKAEGVLPANQRIPGERFKVHDRVRAVVLEVKDGSRGPQIILSRAHRNFLRRLLENEVPEIYHGVVEIRAIAREPGARAKVAVMATQAGVDPVGACVGIKGVRIQAIVKELHDEKIDIIQWDQDPVIYISKAISPARVSGVYLSEVEGNRTATVVVNEDQLSLAIGRDGQNARLAAKLTGWRIDIKSLAEAAGDAIRKLQSDPALAALLPTAIESIPAVEDVLAKKAENRPVTPEEYTMLAQFVDRVERRTIQIKEDAARAEEEKVTNARAEVPTAAFGMPLEELGLKEHVFNILVEAGIDTIGALMMSMKMDANKVLGLPGIGPKAISNIEERLAVIQFPEPPAAEPVAEAVQTAAEPVIEAEAPTTAPQAEAPMAVAEPAAVAAPVAVEETPALEKSAQPKKEPRKPVEEPEDDEHKDGVSLDELFSMKPEIFQTAASEEEESADKKKGKKGKKKSVELELDEERGEVVARKKHKRGDDGFGEDW